MSKEYRSLSVLCKQGGQGRAFAALSLLAVLLTFTSCATIFSGTTAQVYIDGDVDDTLTVVTSKGVYDGLLLPATVDVKRRKLNGQHIQISSERRAYSDIVLRSRTNTLSIVGGLFSGVSLVVDLLTGATYEPVQDRFTIKPGVPRAQADSLHRADSLRLVASLEAERQLQARRQQLPQKYPRHELCAGLGFGTCQASHDRQKMTDFYVEHFQLMGDFECGDIFGDSYLQTGLEYHYRLNRRWDVGGLVDWGLSSDGYDHSSSEQCRFFVAAPSVRCTWMEQPYVRAYSRVALGVMRHHLTFEYLPSDRAFPVKLTDRVKWQMAYHLTAAGITFGSANLHMFAEVGYGCLGVFRFGLAALF